MKDESKSCVINQFLMQDIFNFYNESFSKYRMSRDVEDKYVTVVQIVEALAENAVRKYGLLARTVLRYWGIENTRDVLNTLKLFVKKRNVKINCDFNKDYLDEVFSTLGIGTIKCREYNGGNFRTLNIDCLVYRGDDERNREQNGVVYQGCLSLRYKLNGREIREFAQ